MERIESRANWPLADLLPAARNARLHSPEQVMQIAASIKEFGFTIPILIDERNEIIAGHGRALAAKELGLTHVPVLVARGWTEPQKRAYRLADNKLTLNGAWDLPSLRHELTDLAGLGFNIDLTGFGPDEFKAFTLEPGSGLTDPDDVPNIRPDVVREAGDVWLLGRHRLVCGSCTDQNAIDAALVGARANLALTDPPYGLDGRKESGKNDYVGYDDSRENLVELAQRWLPLARAHANAVVFSPGVRQQWLYPEPDWVLCWFYGGGALQSPWGFNSWQPFLCYGKDPSLAYRRGSRPDAVNMNVSAQSGHVDHPCPKPVKLWQWLIERLVFKPNAIILEPFSGSGTALVAAERYDISVRAIELSPYYVDVALRRWEAFTGKQATHESGLTFAEAARSRSIKPKPAPHMEPKTNVA
jgi:ParB-like chromosome segregation protein Spo0J